MPENRTETGRFASGASGNPGGRPKVGEQEKAAREAMKALCVDAVELLKKTMLDEKANMNLRIRIAEFVVTNVCGRAISWTDVEKANKEEEWEQRHRKFS